MSDAIGVALIIALPLAFAWVFKYVYTFFQPLDEMILENRLRDFEIAGFFFGMIVAFTGIWWMKSGLIQ